MSKVFVNIGLSLDGYMAPDGMTMGKPEYKNWGAKWGALMAWIINQQYFREKLKFGPGGETGPVNDMVRHTFERTGANIMGKRMFEGGERSWPEEAPFHTPVYVLTHQRRDSWIRPGGTTFHFVNDGAESALERRAEAPPLGVQDTHLERRCAARVLAADLPAAARATVPGAASPAAPSVGTVWRIMVERMTASWTTAPHFYLVREVNVSRLVSWLERARTQTGARITYTDLLVKLVAATLAQHPGANASWKDGAIVGNAEVSIGLAVAIDDGLVVPVLHRADTLGLAELAARREDLVSRAQAGKLRPADIQGGGFTLSNLGMYGVDAFNAIVNPPQAAILAVGRIADRVVAVNGQPAVRPTMVLTLSCDHRVLDGARGARFLGALAELIEEPLALLV